MNTIQLSSKEILAKLPQSWSDITLDVYLNKLLNVKITEVDEVDEMFTGTENTMKVAAEFLELPVEVIREFPVSLIIEMNRKLSFLNAKPKPLKKTKYKWIRKMEEPTYDNFVLYLKVSEQLERGDFSNFPLILRSLCQDSLTDEQVMKLPMDEVETGFFLLRKFLLKYLKHMEHTSSVQLIKQTIKEKREQQALAKTSGNGKRHTKKNMVGTSLPKK